MVVLPLGKAERTSGRVGPMRTRRIGLGPLPETESPRSPQEQRLVVRDRVHSVRGVAEVVRFLVARLGELVSAGGTDRYA